MAMRERLVYAIDVVTDGAKTGLAGFKSSISEADGFVNKAKAGWSSAFTTIQQNAGLLAVSGGAAIAAFGAKAVAVFQETAIEAGKFSDATGLAVEDASRWIEVAGDVGISAETIQGVFVKLNKALSTGDLERFGVELQRTSSGAVDVNATMLNAIKVIGGIKDPTERAEAAQKAFGRSYAEAAEIIFANADNVQKKLAEVSDAKVISEDELKRAREFRAAMDDLHDAVEDVMISVGGALVPALTDVAESLKDVTDAASALKIPELLEFGVEHNAINSIKDIGGAIGGLFDGGEDKKLESFVNTAHNLAGVARGEAASGVRELADAAAEMGDRTAKMHAEVDLATTSIEAKKAADEKAKKAAEDHAEAVEAVAEAMENQRDAALQLVGGDIAVRNAQREAEQAASDLNDTLANQETTLAQAGAAIDDAADAQLNAASAAAEYRAQQMEANGQTVDANTKAQLMKEELQKLADKLTGPLKDAILGYIADLAAIPSTVSTNIVLNKPGRVGDTVGTGHGVERRASGGPTAAGSLYEVNENGSELLTENGRTYLMAGANGQVTPLRRGSGGGAPVAQSVSVIHNVYQSVAVGGVVDVRTIEQIRRQIERGARGRL